jgi:phosphoglycerate dehydrogenase-like enzyme
MRLLVHENVRTRCAADFEALAGRLDLVVMAGNGQLSIAGAPISADDAQPDIVFLNADVFFTPLSAPFMDALFRSRVLKWVQSGAAGLDSPVFGKILRMGARLTTSHGQAVGVADYVLWGVLDALQRGPARRAAQAGGEWRRSYAREIDETRWVVLGFGAIGQGVGRRARAFGAHVIGVRRNLDADPDADQIASPAQLHALLPKADVVVLAVPLTRHTRQIADSAFFGAMRAGSVFVNVGRGALVDDAALLAGLGNGAPEHAVLDVFGVEPLPGDSPFWAHPRVTITAHCSGLTEGSARRNDSIFVDNLRRYLAGQPLQNEVDQTPGDGHRLG